MSRLGGAMKISMAFLASAIICVTVPMTMVMAADTPPRWAYIEDNPNYKPPVDDGNLVRVPNSTAVIPGVSCETDSSRQFGTRATMGHRRTS